MLNKLNSFYIYYFVTPPLSRQSQHIGAQVNLPCRSRNSFTDHLTVLYQVLNKQVPVPVPVPEAQVPVPVPVPVVQVPVQVPVLDMQVPVPVPVHEAQVPTSTRTESILSTSHKLLVCDTK